MKFVLFCSRFFWRTTRIPFPLQENINRSILSLALEIFHAFHLNCCFFSMCVVQYELRCPSADPYNTIIIFIEHIDCVKTAQFEFECEIARRHQCVTSIQTTTVIVTVVAKRRADGIDWYLDLQPHNSHNSHNSHVMLWWLSFRDKQKPKKEPKSDNCSSKSRDNHQKHIIRLGMVCTVSSSDDMKPTSTSENRNKSNCTPRIV